MTNIRRRFYSSVASLAHGLGAQKLKCLLISGAINTVPTSQFEIEGYFFINLFDRCSTLPTIILYINKYYQII